MKALKKEKSTKNLVDFLFCAFEVGCTIMKNDWTDFGHFQYKNICRKFISEL
jgi:hypothetical protein